MAWILLLGAGKEQIPAMKAIHHEGHKVAAVDQNEKAEGVELCDAFRPISNRDVDSILKFAEWASVSGVLCAASEIADVGAIVAHRLGLPGIPVATAVACKQKLHQKHIFRLTDIPHTQAHLIYRGSAHATFDLLRYKVVVKPAVGSGSRGVTYVDNPMELPMAVRAAEAIDNDVLMERYQPGPQISSETVIWDDKAVTVAFVDRFYPQGRPVFKEIGGSLPSVWESERPAAHRLITSAAHALGVRRGTLKCDLVLTSEGPKIIEATPRLSGGPLSSLVYDSTGVDYLRQAVRISLGQEPDLDALRPRKNDRVARGMDGKDMDWEESRQHVVGKLGP